MIRFSLILVVAFLFVASLFAVLGYQPRVVALANQKQKPQAYTQCTVKIIYDGDTFGCDLDGDGKISGQHEKIRLLGIDAPEMHYSRKNNTGVDEPYALEATQFLESLILNQRVYLEYDDIKTDKYKRTLSYVYLEPEGKTMLNSRLLEEGLAQTLFLGANRRYEQDFLQAEQRAQKQQVNLWQAVSQP